MGPTEIVDTVMAIKNVVIIGGGISGLTTAYELTRRGHHVTVLDRRETLGGLARSVQIGDRDIERYYHFICGGDQNLIELIAELGLSARLHWRPGKTSYFVQGRMYPFTTPLDLLGFSAISLLSRIRFALHAARCRQMRNWQDIEHLTAQEWLLDTVGSEAYEVIWRPLLQIKFGRYYDQVSAPWLWHRVHRFSQSRHSLWRPEQLGYLEGGSQVLIDALAEFIVAGGGKIHLNTAATGIVQRKGRAAAVSGAGQQWDADAVVSAIALPELVPLLPSSVPDYQQRLASINFVAVRCLLLVIEHSLSDSFWTNINDSRIFFNGLIEYSNLNPWRQYGGAEIAYIPIYMPADEELFVWPQDDLTESVIGCLEIICPQFDRSWIREAIVTQDLHAQAICPPGFSQRMPAPAAPLPGLYVVDSTQLYPSDRCLSGMIGLARTVGHMIDSQ